MLHYYFYITQ